MPKRKQPSQADLDAELTKLDLRPDDEARKGTDDLLRRLLATPPDPFTPKPKKAPKTKPVK